VVKDYVDGEIVLPVVRRAQNEALLDWMNRYVLGIKPEPKL